MVGDSIVLATGRRVGIGELLAVDQRHHPRGRLKIA
jgi:hypothetical protein